MKIKIFINYFNPDFLTNNQFIDNNNYGIYLSGDCILIFVSGLSELNNINGNGTNDLYNGTQDITSEFIYLGTINHFEIENQIYDHNEYSSLSIVDFVPYTNATHDITYLASIEPPQNVIITTSSDSVLITWDAVIEDTSYEVNTSDDLYAGFTEGTTGTFNGQS